MPENDQLKETLRDSVSKTGSGWARNRPHTALILQKNLSQLTHWGTDIRNATHKTLEKVEREDEAFAVTIQTQLVVAKQHVSQLRRLCEGRSNDTVFEVDIEAGLIESIQVSIKGLQYQVDPLRAFTDYLNQPRAQGSSASDVHLSNTGASTEWTIAEGAFFKSVDGMLSLLNEPESDLQRLIKSCFLRNFEDKTFCSASSLRKAMTLPLVTVFLRREYPDLSESAMYALVRQITTRFLNVFAILVHLNMGGQIAIFIEKGISDHQLPLTPNFRSRDEQPDCFRMDGRRIPLDWTLSELKSFGDIQWQFLTPVMNSRHYQHLRLDSRVPLPWWTEVKGLEVLFSRSASEHARKFVIEPSSHDLIDITTDKVVVETMLARRGANKSKALSVLYGLKDPHLLPSYGAIEQSDHLYLIFPWIQCNLKEYWRSNSGILSSESNSREDPATWDNIIWLSDQLRGIANGLATIHGLRDWKLLRPNVIMPEKILLMRASKEVRGKLVIGGLCQLDGHCMRDGVHNAWLDVGRDVYTSPEHFFSGRGLGKPLDVWSLGCIMLEFMCWALGGIHMVESFARKRTGFPVDLTFDTFFSTMDLTFETFFKYMAGAKYVIKPAVTECFQYLRGLPQCTEFVNDILDIVQGHMLVIQSDDRASALELTDMLNSIHNKVIASEAYATRSMPIEKRPVTKQEPLVDSV